MNELIPQLYLHGLALGDFELALRLRTDAAKRYKKVENATTVIWKMLLLAEQRFQRLNAPEKLMSVYLRFNTRKEVKEGAIIREEEVLAVA